LTEGIRITDRYQVLVNVVEITKILATIAVLVVLRNFPAIQILILLNFALAKMSYIKRKVPYEERL